MAIQEIKYRGISRTPSDRMTEDGGCAESLNFYIDNTENCPAVPPVLLEDEVHLPIENDYEVIYIHKHHSGTDYICKKGYTVGVWTDDSQDPYTPMFTFEQGETLNSITSVGNTVIISTDKRVFYIRYKDGIYEPLGSNLPAPDVKIYSDDITMLTEETYKTTTSLDPYTTGKQDNASQLTISNFFGVPITTNHFGNLITGGEVTKDDTPFVASYAKGLKWSGVNNKALDRTGEVMLSNIWNMVAEVRDFNHRYGILSSPVFLTVGVRLYDGTVYAPCAPIALGLQNSISGNDFTVKVRTCMSNDESKFAASATVILKHGYKINIEFGSLTDQYGEWKDIVESVDVFITEPVRLEQSLDKCKIDAVSDPWGSNNEWHTIDLTLDPDTVCNKEKLEQSLVSSTVFHKIYSCPFGEFGDIDDTVKRIDEDLRLDNLATCETLEPEFATNHKLRADDMMTYNGRLMLSGITSEMSKGNTCLNGAALESSTSLEFRYIFQIPNDNGELLTVKSDIISNKLSDNTTVLPWGFLSYPDSRCRTAYVGTRFYASGQADNVGWTWYKIPMKEFPMLDASYCFFGFRKLVSAYEGAEEVSLLPSESREERKTGYIYQSKTSNPYFFPNVGRIKVNNSDIVSLATTTKALSDGQFGSYPIYAFTKEGIWAMSLNDTGGIVTSVPLSRDVAVSSNMVIPVDQAIVFLTDKGMKVLSGSDIAEISQYMNGRHWSIDATSSEYGVINSSEWKEYLATLVDDESFMAYMKSATGIYDYTGARIIFFNGSKKFQYVYKLDSQTWHKIQIPWAARYKFRKCLNSYPDCLVSVGRDFTRQAKATCEDPDEIDEQKISDILEDYGFEDVNVSNFIAGTGVIYPWFLSEDRMVSFEKELGEEGLALVKTTATTGAVLNFSTPLEGNDTTTEITSLLVSRPFTLGQDDVHKTINEIKSRGMFESKDSNGMCRVRYILLGSQDGIKFQRLGSLRGKSWKFFRIMVLTKLRPYERFTGTVLDFVTRFTNKLR